MTTLLKLNPIYKTVQNTLMNLPTPKNISYMWNMGSMLFLCLIMQILTGLLLASTFSPSLISSFEMMNQIMETMNKSWLARYSHANGASLFFICLYAHMARGIYNNSFLMTHTWMIGVTIFIMTMATAFTGYILPANQMSFWGASVITNLFSEVPYIGPDLVTTIWGGPNVDTPTMMRFFAFHFTLPFIILFLVLLHITMLHTTGSSNPLGAQSNNTKILFTPNFSMKDLLGLMLTITLFILMCVHSPLYLGDNENFTKADSSLTPHHIQPEWYFLFAYAILRSIPNKLGGVLALMMSIMILYTMPYSHTTKMKNMFTKPFKTGFWFFTVNMFMLTWIGARPVEEPYILTGQVFTFTYFLYFLAQPLIFLHWEKFLKM